MRGPTPTATYRFQLTPTFGFDRAAAQLDRAAATRRSATSTCRRSPRRCPGSTHGYDVVDHARVRDELGGLDGLTALLDACAGRGMGVVVDHVPNHTAVGRPELNAALVGDAARRSRRARRRGGSTSTGRRPAGRSSCPVLGAPLDDVAGDLDDRRRRAAPRAAALAAARRAPSGCRRRTRSARQHYRLQWWRDPARNVRRFFTIDDLVGRARRGSRRRRRRRHRAAAARRPPGVRRRPRRPRRRARRSARLPGGAAGRDRRPLAARREDPRRRRDAAAVVAGRGHDRLRARHRAGARPARPRRAGPTLREHWVAITGDDRPFRAWELEARREVLDGGLRPTSSASRASPGWPTPRPSPS